MCMRGRCLARRRLTMLEPATPTDPWCDPDLIFFSYREPNYVLSNNSPRLNRSPLTAEELRDSPFGKLLKLRSRSVDSPTRTGGSTSQFLLPPKENYFNGNAIRLLPKWTNEVSPVTENDKRNSLMGKHSASFTQLPISVDNAARNTMNINEGRGTGDQEQLRNFFTFTKKEQQGNSLSDKTTKSISTSSTSSGSINSINLISDGSDEESEEELLIMKF